MLKKHIFLLFLLSIVLLVDFTFAVNGDDDNNNVKYAVVFDAGSTGSRVHVVKFDENLNLLPLGQEYELFEATKPGLSSYEKDPESAALSLKPLLKRAEDVIPEQIRPKTPLKLGATAGLRLLKGNAAEEILQAVRSFFKKESSLNYKGELITILKGFEEGTYQWMTINYLLGRLGKAYPNTVGVVDLGGGSVQIAYAISEETAKKAPKFPPGEEDPYVSEKLIMSQKYNLYVHSFLNYGLMAARAQSLKLSGPIGGNPCVTNGFKGTYTYTGVEYQVFPPRSGTNLRRCRALARNMLGLDAQCPDKKCSFNGVWNGGGGDGLKNLHVSSSFYDTASFAGLIKQNTSSAVVRPASFLNAAKLACTGNVGNMKSIFPYVEDREVPYLCMDLVYEYTLLVDGFGLSPLQKFTLLNKVEYKGSMIGAAWPLGCAIDLLSSLK